MVEGQAHRKTSWGGLRVPPGCRRARRLRWASVWALLALSLAAPPGSGAADPCAPWPGEPSPLPQVSDPDELRARWASLRTRELTQAARSLEHTAPVLAHGLWRRVLCLDPASDEAVAGLGRTEPVVVHRPPVVARPGEDAVGDAWAGLARPVPVPPPPRRPAPPAPPPPDPREQTFAQALAEVEARVRAAEFVTALESAVRARQAAEALGAAAGSERRARLEVLAATAELALGRSDAAASSFARALDADPDLRLDETRTSPKVRRAFERARAARQGGAP